MRSCVIVCAALLAACGDNLTVDPGPVPASSAMALQADEGAAVGFTVAATGKNLKYSMSAPQHGAIAGSGPSYIYTPAHDWHGVEDLRVTISDGTSSVDVSVIITVVAEDVAPVPGIDTFVTNENTPLVLPESALLANDTAYDPSLLTIVAVGDAQHGSVALASGSVTFTPAHHFSGTAGFGYTVTDGTRSAEGRVGVAVQFVDDAPVATDDTATTAEDTPLSIPMTVLLANDTDDDRQTLAVTAVANAAHCSAAISGTSVVVTPAANYDGAATFDYTITDGTLTASATVTVTVTPVDDAPVASDQSVTVDEDSSIAVTLGATDIDSPSLDYVAAPPAHGTLTGTAPNLTYTPSQFFSGSDSFTFTASDGQLSSNVATVSITVTHEIECGDGVTEGSEQCDDGASNGSAGDGCNAACQLLGWQTTTPVAVDAGQGCSILEPNAARQISVDAGGAIYVAMACNGGVQVAASSNRGHSFAAPIDLGATDISEIAVAGAGAGVAYVAMEDFDTDRLWLSKTTDGGQTFSAPAEIGNSFGAISLIAFGDTVLVAANAGSVTAVLRSTDDGATFTPAVLPQLAFFDVYYDPATSTVIVAGDTPQFYVLTSSDGGATFSPASNPPGTEHFSDWGFGNGTIYAAGRDDGLLYEISESDPTTSTSVNGLPEPMFSVSVSAAAGGDAFVGSTPASGGVELDHLAFGATSFDTPRVLSATAQSIVIDALPGNATGAVVAYQDQGALYVTVQTY